MDWTGEQPGVAIAVGLCLAAMFALSLAQLRGRSGPLLRAGRWLASLGLAAVALGGLAFLTVIAPLMFHSSPSLGQILGVAGSLLALYAVFVAALVWLVGWCRGRARRALPVAAISGSLLLGSAALKPIWYCEPLGAYGWGPAQWCAIHLYNRGFAAFGGNRERTISWIRRASDGGDLHASYLLAQWETDPAQRTELLRRSADGGVSDAAYQLYRLSVLRGNEQPDLEALRLAAEGGHPDGLYETALRLRRDSPRERDRYRETLLDAAEAGSAEARFELAGLYARDNDVVRRDVARSRDWEERARLARRAEPAGFFDLQHWPRREQPNAERIWKATLESFRNLGDQAEQGKVGAQKVIAEQILSAAAGDPEVEAHAAEWLERAARGGSDRSALELVRLYEKRPDTDAGALAEAVGWLARTAEQGGDLRREALHELIRVHREGRLGQPSNEAAAIRYARELYQLEAESGRWDDARAAAQLIHGEPASVPPAITREEAAALFVRSRVAESRDRALAWEWLVQSAEAGYPPAQYDAAMMLLNRIKPEKDAASQAGKLLHAAAEAGHRGAMYRLAEQYRPPHGEEPVVPEISRDPERALYWYRRALEGVVGQTVQRIDGFEIRRSTIEQRIRDLENEVRQTSARAAR